MVRRRRRRRVYRFKMKKSILFLILMGILTFLVTQAYFQPPLMTYAKQKSSLVASSVINNAIMEQVVPNIDTTNLVLLDSDNSGNITSVTVNTYQANLILSKMTKQIEETVVAIENDPDHELNTVTIPFSAMFSNPVITFGPYMKVKYTMLGSVESDIVSTVKPYGINNSLFEVVIKTKVKYQIAIPFQGEVVEVVTRTPILIKVIHGTVPHFYYSAPGDQLNIPDVSELY